MKCQYADLQSKLRTWVKRFIILTVFFFPLKMAFEVSRVPNYDEGKAYIDYSPDGQYRAALVYIHKKNKTAWTNFATALTWKSPYSVYLISDPTGKDIYAITHIEKNWRSNGSGTIWRCGKSEQNSCHGFLLAYNLEGSLPPSLWQRTHAWLTVRIKGFQNAQFGEVVNLDH